MKLVFFGKGQRGVSTLQALTASDHQILSVVIHPMGEGKVDPIAEVAKKAGISVLSPQNPNAEDFIAVLKGLKADLFVLGGYGLILRSPIIGVPSRGCVNLHGGKLPKYRGSSPLNWALINGEKEFTLSVIRVDAGVDTGDILDEKTFPVSMTDTIVDLHSIANREFPSMLLGVLKGLEAGTCQSRPQSKEGASYYPLRFPDDGLILWDQLTAEQVHHRIRGLTEPYPCAFALFQGRRVKLISSMLTEVPYHGEPGRIYQITDRGMLICASDRCLWITRAVFSDDGTSLVEKVRRYDRLTCLRDALLQNQGTPIL